MSCYVLQVAPGEEEKAETYIKKMLPAGSWEKCFHPTRIVRKKFHGKWVEMRERLLPGYVFVTAEDAAGLYVQLQKIPILTKFLGKDGEYFVKLAKEEEQWLNRLLGPGNPSAGGKGGEEVGLSQIAFDEGNEVRIVSGPLKDMQGLVRKINLHKRVAEVEVPFMSGSTVIYLGIEMVERT